MYMLKEAENVVPIPPSRLGEDIESIVGALACELFEGKLNDAKELTVLVKNVRPIGEGHIVHGDGAVYQTVKYDQIVFKLNDNEVVEGEVVEVMKFGAFVRFGPLDGLLHISQVLSDRVDVDSDNQRLVGKDSKKTLGVGDKVKARVVSMELNDRNPQDSRIGLTMRQAGLGRKDWIEEEASGKGKGDE